MSRTTLSHHFFIWLLLISLIPIVFLAYFYLDTFRNTFLKQEQNHLSLLADEKVKEIEDYIDERMTDARLLSQSHETMTAFQKLVPAYKNKKAQPLIYQKLEKEFNQYDQYLQERGYHDIYLISPAGEIILSKEHKSDYATNIYTGLYRNSGLNQVVRHAKFMLESSSSSFKYYEPSDDAAAFIAAPVFHKGQFLGVIALHINADIIQKMALGTRGTMQSREVVIVSRVGDEFSFQTKLKHKKNAKKIVGKILPVTKLGPTLFAATEGINKIGLDTDYRKTKVIAISRYIPSMNWALVVKEDLDEAMYEVNQLVQTSIYIIICILLGVIFLARYLGKIFADPIVEITQSIRTLAEGNLDIKVKPSGYKESIDLAESFNNMSLRLKNAKNHHEYQKNLLQRINKSLLEENNARVKAENNLLLSKQASEHSEQKIRAITDQSTEGITVADMEGNYTFVNAAFCKMMGYSENELLQKTVFDLKAPQQDLSSFDKSKSSEEGIPIQVLLQRKDGTEFISELIGKKIVFDGQEQVLGTVHDITERVHAIEQIHMLSIALEQSPVSIMITDTDANIEYVNSSFENITGYSAIESLGKNPRFLKPYDAPESYFKSVWHAITRGNTWRGELQSRKKNGEVFWELASFSPVLDESGVTRHYLAVKEDITLRRKQEQQILRQAHFDALTNLPNRLLSLDRLSQLISDAQRNNDLVAVMFLDLDGFKTINDTMGHDVGDRLLVESAQRLRTIVRDKDTVGRLGGDEFVVLLGGLKKVSDVNLVAENLLDQFRVAFKIDDRELMLTTSMGIAIFPTDGTNVSELLRNSDMAMYYAKDQGRNTYFYFTEKMNRGVSRRLALEEQIHGALDRDEFEILYQPQIEVSSGKMVGTEALLRWKNPILGHVSPVEFIPVAEQTGLIVSLGKFVLTEALAQTAEWHKYQKPCFRIAVNFSPRQFRDPELVDFVEISLQHFELSGDSLELEITEGVLMNGQNFIHKALAALNKLGVSIAMDDFGTGYSSLNYLRKYPFNVLKIDRSFIHDIANNPAAQELVNATIAMSHGLNLKVVAEGIETEEQLNYLKEKRCDYAQGNLLGKPMRAVNITEILAKNN